MRVLILLLLALSACAPISNVPLGRDGAFSVGAKPGYPKLGAALPVGSTRYSNRSLADVFVLLTHGLEWGANRPNLVRYEAPISVGLTGPGSVQYAGFLDSYLAQLRSRSGITIARGPGPHNLAIRFVPGNAFRRRAPRQSCLVAPGQMDWATFATNPARYGTRAFETQTALSAMTVFIPDNAEPFLVRICLIEEIAQALGPANDLYGLGPSIFNDDGAHVWPTRLDYLMLRVLYAPEMRTGLSAAETRSRARTVLDRLNPEGRAAPSLPVPRPGRMARWSQAIRDAFKRGGDLDARRADARKAVAIAARQAPGSAYHCRALSALVRLTRTNPAEARQAATDGQRICASAHGLSDIRLARLQLDTARLLYDAGSPAAAMSALRGLEDTFAAHGQEERLTAFYALQAASLRAIQQGTKSFEARRRAAEWGAYALGRDHADVRRLQIR